MIYWGPRAVLSLVGVVMLILGVWYVDRTWDEEGSAAYERAETVDPSNVQIPVAELDGAFRFPAMFLAGWGLFGLSYLFPANGGSGIDFSIIAVLTVLTSFALASVGSIPMGDAVRNRRAKKKQVLSMLFLGFWVALAVLTGVEAENRTPTFIFSAVGMVSIVVSMMFLWKHRKMGTSWEETGKPNPNPAVYNLGGPLFVLGWVLFWIAMASTNPTGLEGGLEVHFNLRTALAFVAGVGVVATVLMIDYAHDEGGEYVGFGTDGTYFGRFLETPVLFILFWALFGFVSVIGVDNALTEPDLRSWLLLVTAVVMGLYVGLLVQTSIYKGDSPRVQKLAMGFAFLFVLLAINLAIDGGAARYLAIVGAIFVVSSQAMLMNDRKRGKHWMLNGETNPKPIVYSYGALLFTAGWILVSWSMSLPMGTS